MSAQDISHSTDVSPAKNVDDPRKRSVAPWIVLALWFAWLAVLVALSIPYWGGSKEQIKQIREQQEPDVEAN